MAYLHIFNPHPLPRIFAFGLDGEERLSRYEIGPGARLGIVRHHHEIMEILRQNASKLVRDPCDPDDVYYLK